MILANPTMVCSYPYYCIDLTVKLVYYQMERCALRLHHVCQGEYVAMHEINLDGAERNICHDFVDKIWMGGKPETLKKVGHNTVYRAEELEEEEE